MTYFYAKKPAASVFSRVAALLLIFALLFGDVARWLPWGDFFSWLETERSLAANGDFSIYQNSSDASEVTTTPLSVVWDTTTQSASSISLLGDNESIDLADGGKYLVLYNVWTEKGAGAGTDRRSFETRLSLDGVSLPYGRAASYFRDVGGEDVAAYAAGGTILDASAGQDLEVQIARDDTNTSAESFIRPGTNGVSVLKLDDGYDYLRLYDSTRSGDIGGNTSFTDVSFDTADEVDAGSFDFTASSTASNITLKGNIGDKFLITTNVRLHNDSGNNNRQNYETRLTLDGTEVSGTRSVGYIRGQQGTDFTTISYSGIVEKTQSGDQTLNLELRRESVTGVATDIVANETALSAVALPAGANYVMLTSGSSQTLTPSQSPLLWDEQVSLDGTAFAHATGTNNSRVNINAGGDYLFFSTAYTSRASDSDRNVPRLDWRLDGTSVVDYGGHGSFNRGDQGVDDAFTSGSSGGVLLSGVTGGQYLELLQSDETGDTPNAAFPAQRVALQGIDIASLAQIDTTVSLAGQPQNEIAPDTTEFLAESFVVKEETAGRNLTNLVLSEQGSVDAETDLNNIAVYYDLDTSSPYDCTSESYDGTEAQFGSTDSNGFTSPNGTVSYTDSVAISPTSALCAYVVLDVGSGARDSETIDVYVNDVPSDVVVTGSGSIGPTGGVGGGTQTTVRDAEITQANYHWRNDDGSETGATSATDGNADTPALAFSTTTPQRLRLNVFANGTGSSTNEFRLEYAEKAGSCSLATGWNRVGAGGGAWDLFDSPNVTNGADTTNIPESAGGLPDPAPQFLIDNNGFLDTSDQTGPINLGDGELRSVGEFGSVTVSNGSTTTVSLDNTYNDPIVTASVRYSRSGPNQRTSRVTSKSATDFTVLVENYDNTLPTGSTTIDYVVMEAGEWDVLNDAGANVQVFATSTTVASSAVAARSITTPPASSSIITYPTSFTDPVVLASVTSNNDPDWVFASVYDGTSVTSPPSGTTVGVFMNENFESDGHGANETVDVLVFEGGAASYAGTEYRFTTSGSANVTQTPTSISYASVDTTPAVTTVQSLTTNGADGGFAMVDSDNPPTATDVTVTIDEDGPSADRGHGGAEEVAAAVFGSEGRFFVDEIINREFLEVEYALQATNAATEGVGYCFRVSDAGTPLRNYGVYPEATLNADVTVSATGTQVTQIETNSTDIYTGGTFAVQDNVASRTVTSVTLEEVGSVNASSSLANVRLAYDLDQTAPYNCADQLYNGTEPLFGATLASGFTGPNGTATFTDSVAISTSSTMCLYPVLDVLDGAVNGETLELAIADPSSDVVVSSGSVGPGSQIALNGSTTVASAELAQTGYHWRANDGTEVTATSLTGGVADSPAADVQRGETVRLRLAVSNDGAATSSAATYELEYGTKVSTCSSVSNWQAIDVGAAFTMASSSQLTDGADTTNIAVADGGVVDGNTTFLSVNGGQRDQTPTTGALTLTPTEFVELEYAIQPTEQSGFGTEYCFRVSNAGNPLPTYNAYGELQMQEKQDFIVQRGTETVSGTSTDVVAGVDYTPPVSPNAFVRITNTSMTGAGSDTLGAQRAADDLFAYITDASDLSTGFTITRPPTATDNTRVSWEIVEYAGITGADNEMLVHEQGTITYGANALTATGTTVAGVSDDNDVVVFITGQYNPDTGVENYNTGLSTARWDEVNDRPIFDRADADGVAAAVSYAVVEFTGVNWDIQRVEHQYTAAGTAETETITAVSSLGRAFLHPQKRVGDELYNLDETGHEVWLSSIGAVSFELESGATNPGGQVSVAWVIANNQTNDGALEVYRSNGVISEGTVQPETFTFSIGNQVSLDEASIWASNRSTGAGNFHPRAFLGARLTSETEYELWKSDEGQNQAFRVEVVDWPTAQLSTRQSYYRFYVDDDSVAPTDPWPVGGTDLGENMAMTDLDEPLGEGERVHIRMSLFVNNATLVSDSQSFTLQYGRRVTSCEAVSSWTNVGAPGSAEVWRGFDATPVDGTTLDPADLLLSVADIGGTYEEVNDSSLNPNAVGIGEYVEYGWLVENNGALQRSNYCFRMVEAGGGVLNGYDEYPVVRTSGYTPVTTDWRWYTDIDQETPSNPAANLNASPSGVSIDDTFKLRVAVDEIEGAAGQNIKFNLEYSEYADFRDGGTVLTATSSCSGGKLWCYADGVDEDNDVISTATLPNVDSCSGSTGPGCGLHNEIAGLTSPFNHDPFTSTEHEFTLRQDGARVNAVYYFRLVDATNGVPVTASSSYPSAQVSSSTLSFSVSGLSSGTTTAGVTTDIATTPSTVSFASLPLNQSYFAAHRLNISTNATDGYQLFMYTDQNPTNTYGDTIAPITASNVAPSSWSAACDLTQQDGCFGYHTTDATLEGGSTRFSALDTYAALDTSPQEVMYSPVPVSDVHDIVYQIAITGNQPAGDYQASMTFIAVPVF